MWVGSSWTLKWAPLDNSVLIGTMIFVVDSLTPLVQNGEQWKAIARGPRLIAAQASDSGYRSKLVLKHSVERSL
jgi:hypothetical protein